MAPNGKKGGQKGGKNNKKKGNRGKRTGKPRAKGKGKGPRDKIAAERPIGQGMSLASKWTEYKVPGGIGVRGREYIKQVAINAAGTNAFMGATITQYDCNPTELQGTRLELLGAMYSKWYPKRLKFEYAAAATTATTGNLTFAFQTDPSAVLPPPNEQGIRETGSWKGSWTTPVYESWSTEFTFPKAANNTYYTNVDADISGDMRMEYPGYFVVMNTTGIQNAAGVASLVLGALYMDYDIVFMDPTFNSDKQLCALYVSPNQLVDPSTVARAGLNLMQTAGVNAPFQALGDIGAIPLLQDASANTFFQLPEGVWLVHQTFQNATGTSLDSLKFGNPSLVFIALVVGNNAVITLIHDMPGSSTSTAPGSCSNLSIVAVPQGGVNCFGKWAGTSSGTCTVGIHTVLISTPSLALAAAFSVTPPTLRHMRRLFIQHGQRVPTSEELVNMGTKVLEPIYPVFEKTRDEHLRDMQYRLVELQVKRAELRLKRAEDQGDDSDQDSDPEDRPLEKLKSTLPVSILEGVPDIEDVPPRLYSKLLPSGTIPTTSRVVGRK